MRLRFNRYVIGKAAEQGQPIDPVEIISAANLRKPPGSGPLGKTAGSASPGQRSAGVTFEAMNENNSAGLLRDVMAWKLGQKRAGGGPSSLEQLIRTSVALRRLHAATARVLSDVHHSGRMPAIFMGKTCPDVTFSGSVALPAMTAGGTVTMIPPVPADYVAEAMKLSPFWQMLVIRLVTLIIIVAPAAAFAEGLPVDVQVLIGVYVGAGAAYSGAYTFSDRTKPRSTEELPRVVSGRICA